MSRRWPLSGDIQRRVEYALSQTLDRAWWSLHCGFRLAEPHVQNGPYGIDDSTRPAVVRVQNDSYANTLGPVWACLAVVSDLDC